MVPTPYPSTPEPGPVSANRVPADVGTGGEHPDLIFLLGPEAFPCPSRTFVVELVCACELFPSAGGTGEGSWTNQKIGVGSGTPVRRFLNLLEPEDRRFFWAPEESSGSRRFGISRISQSPRTRRLDIPISSNQKIGYPNLQDPEDRYPDSWNQDNNNKTNPGIVQVPASKRTTN